MLLGSLLDLEPCKELGGGICGRGLLLQLRRHRLACLLRFRPFHSRGRCLSGEQLLLVVLLLLQLSLRLLILKQLLLGQGLLLLSLLLLL